MFIMRLRRFLSPSATERHPFLLYGFLRGFPYRSFVAAILYPYCNNCRTKHILGQANFRETARTAYAHRRCIAGTSGIQHLFSLSLMLIIGSLSLNTCRFYETTSMP